MTKTELLQRALSGQDLCAFGMDDYAYIKPVLVDGHKVFAIHAADGTPLTTASDRDVAFATVRQHEMEPTSVH
jgi:hypothetical protein